MAIGRDKRKEYNEIVVGMRRKLISARDGSLPFQWDIPAEEIDKLAHYLWWRRRRKFLRALWEYHAIWESQRLGSGPYGTRSHDAASIKARINDILHLIEFS